VNFVHLCRWIANDSTSFGQQGILSLELLTNKADGGKLIKQLQMLRPPERVTLILPCRDVLLNMHTAIDLHHSRCHQGTLGIEEKVEETKDWSMRVNLSILAMIVVDAWLRVCSSDTKKHGDIDFDLNQKSFYMNLAEDIIDNWTNQKPKQVVLGKGLHQA